MKKLINLLCIIILIFSLTFYSCGGNDNETNELSYTVTLEEECRGAKEEYCITETEYERIKSFINTTTPNNPCIWITIKDINNRNHSGYYRSSGVGSGNINCI